jgi:hypothetical protein
MDNCRIHLGGGGGGGEGLIIFDLQYTKVRYKFQLPRLRLMLESKCDNALYSLLVYCGGGDGQRQTVMASYNR